MEIISTSHKTIKNEREATRVLTFTKGTFP